MFGKWHKRAEFLWQLLDDIDTAGDIAKGNMKLYERLVGDAHKKRFKVAGSDGYRLFWKRQVPKVDFDPYRLCPEREAQ